MTDKRLADLILEVRSDCSTLSRLGLDQWAAPMIAYIPRLESIAGVGSAGAVPEGVEMPASGDDRLLTVQQVAEKLGVSPDHVYRHAASWPFTRRVGTRALRFSEQGLEFWLRKQKKGVSP